jgi:Tfp pilus assembly protein PilF
VALVAAVVYASTLSNAPVLDDSWVIFDNSLIKSLKNVPAIFYAPYNVALRSANAGVYRPITTLTYAVNYALGGKNVIGYHAVNIALHVLCSLSVLGLARVLMRSPPRAVGPLLAALLFALHPVHVEAVTAMVGRAELLAALGSLGCLYLVCTRSKARWRLPAALALLAIGVLSKENAAVTPLLWGLIALVLPSAAGLEERPGLFSPLGRRELLRAGAIAAGMGCAAATYFVLRPGFGSLGVSGGSQWFEGQPAGVVFNTMTRVLAEYLKLLVFPHPLGVDFYYSNKIPFPPSFNFVCFAATATWLAVLAFGVAALRRAPVVAVGVLWIFIALLPVLNIIPIGTLMAERLLYLPSVGFCIAAGSGLAFLVDPTRGRLRPAWLTSTAVLIVLLAFGAKTWSRNLDWRDGLTLWEAELRKEPQDVVVNNNLAVEYTACGELAKARERLEVALRGNPAYWRAYVNLGIVAHKLHDDAAAIRAFEEAHRLEPNAASPDFFMAQLFADGGDLSRAVEYLTRAERAEPLDARTPLFRGWYLYRMGRLEEAASELNRAAELDPANPESRSYLAEIARKQSELGSSHPSP